MTYDRYSYLDISVSDGVAHVLNNDPERRNAFTPDGHEEWAFLYHDLARDDDVRAVVLGAHGKHFSVGPDRAYLEGLATSATARRRGFLETEHLVYAPTLFDKPVVSAITGVAIGGALTYALMADVVVADRTAVFSDGHVAVGLVPGDGGLLTWVTYAGLLKAKRYLLTGDRLSAEEAERIGLVTEVVDEGQALDRATEYARRLADLPPDAVRHTKRALNQWLRMYAPAVFDHSHALEALTMLSPDFRDRWAAASHENRRATEH